MAVYILVIAVPIFLLLIGFELLVAHHLGKNIYRLKDTIANLAIGMGSEVIGAFSKSFILGFYLLAYHSIRQTEINSAWLIWPLALVGVDFCYYWSHRMGHGVNLLWSFHVVHHQSEEYNLAVALRQSWFGGFISWIFYLPLAVLGIPPEIFAASLAINLLYQFLIHTQLVGKMGWFELVFNTPSHHRVHHGTNFKYLDKNYGGALIIWDRIFGTFQTEEEAPAYGIVKPWGHYNAIVSNVEPLASLIRNTVRMNGLSNKIKLWFNPPGWEPGDQSFIQTQTRIQDMLGNRHPIQATPYRNKLFPIIAALVAGISSTVAIMILSTKPVNTLLIVLAVLAMSIIHFLGRTFGHDI